MPRLFCFKFPSSDRAFVLAVTLALAGLVFPILAAADQPTQNDAVQVKNPKTLGVDQLSVERISVGISEDYKPCLVKLPDGELLLAGFYAPSAGGVPAEYCFQYRSHDGGRKWSQRRRLDSLAVAGSETPFS